MNGYIWSALGLGFLGSLHCIGMCGPIALALPKGFNSKTALLVSRIAYNAGRILTYAILGVACGALGQMISMAGFQRWVSIVSGVLILLAIIAPKLLAGRIGPNRVIARIVEKFRAVWGRLFAVRSLTGLFGIGALNGLLPCGLVYVALAAAVASGTALQGAGYMALFGAGTFPAMFAISMFGSLMPEKIRRTLVRGIPVGATVLALLLILRGMSLGIPYLSPNLHPQAPPTSTKVHDCCK
ncbi:MAG: sulfite exporter TauE/SafE family protein [Candidatus Zixiibacteriota bacterium]